MLVRQLPLRLVAAASAEAVRAARCADGCYLLAGKEVPFPGLTC